MFIPWQTHFSFQDDDDMGEGGDEGMEAKNRGDSEPRLQRSP